MNEAVDRFRESTPTDCATGAAQGRGARARLLAFLEYFALCGFAFAQPLLSAFAGDADRLLAGHSWSRLAVGMTLATGLLLPASTVWGLSRVVAGLVPRQSRAVVPSLVLGGIVGLFVHGHAHREFIPPTAVAMGATAAAAFTVLHRRWLAVRTAVRWLAVAPLASATLFVLDPMVSASAVPLGGHLKSGHTPTSENRP